MAQITEKRTVISSSSGGSWDDIGDIAYKPSFGTRASNIMSRSSASPLRSSTGGSTVVRTVEYGYGSNMGSLGPGGYSTVSQTGVKSVKTNREKEKKDLQDLNERFASYIEKVRFLEAQNRKLGNELDELRSKWGKETSNIKQMYEAELAEARKLIDDLSRDKANFEIKMNSAQEQLADSQRQLDEAKKYRQIDREQINKLNQQLADYESEINMLRRSVESLETERSRDKNTIQRLQAEVDKLRIDLNNETLAHLDAENRRQTLEEEMEFMKKVHEQELKELAALALRDSTQENREYWKSELSQAIRDIQQEYDSKVDQLRGDMEGFYNLKIQEYRTGATKQNMEVTHVREENKKLTKQMTDLRGRLADLEARNAQLEKQYQDLLREYEAKDGEHMMEVAQLKEEISKLRNEMEGILTELQTLMDAKLSLELEICAYRKLLEGEENRVDWRSGSALVRDTIRPRYNFGYRDRERMRADESASVDDRDSRRQDPVSPDSHTDAASSITMSDSALSQEGDDEMRKDKADVDDKTNGEGGTTLVESSGPIDSSDVDEVIIGSRGKDVESPVIEHNVIVKEEVRKIETQILSPSSSVDDIDAVKTSVSKQREEDVLLSAEDQIQAEKQPEVASSPVIEKMEIVEEPSVSSVPPSDVKQSPEETKSIAEDSLEDDIKTSTNVDGNLDVDQVSEMKDQYSPIKEETSPPVDSKLDDVEQLSASVDVPAVADQNVPETQEKSPNGGHEAIIPEKTSPIDDKTAKSEESTSLEKDTPIPDQTSPISEQTSSITEDTSSVLKETPSKTDEISTVAEVGPDEEEVKEPYITETITSPERTPPDVKEPSKLEGQTSPTSSDKTSPSIQLSPAKESATLVPELYPDISGNDKTTPIDEKKSPVKDIMLENGNKSEDIEEDISVQDHTLVVEKSTGDVDKKSPDSETSTPGEEEVALDVNTLQENDNAEIKSQTVKDDTESVAKKDVNVDTKGDTVVSPSKEITNTSTPTENIDTKELTEINTEAEPKEVSYSEMNTEDKNLQEDNSKTEESINTEEESMLDIKADYIEKDETIVNDTETSSKSETKDDIQEDDEIKTTTISNEERTVEHTLLSVSSETHTSTTESKSTEASEATTSENATKGLSITEKMVVSSDESTIEVSERVEVTEVNETSLETERLEDQSKIEAETKVEKTETVVTVKDPVKTPELLSPVKQITPTPSDEPQINTSLTNGLPEETPKQSISDANTLDGITEESQKQDKANINDDNDTSIKTEKDSSPTEEKTNEDSKSSVIYEEVPDVDKPNAASKEDDTKPQENGLVEQGKEDSQMSMKMMRGEVSAKTTYQRTSTGPIAICEVSPEGKFIMLENTSSGPNRRDVNLDGWCLKRVVDGKREYLYNFRNFTLKSGKKVKILARGNAGEAGLNDLVFRDEDSWGVGSQVTTSLINDKSEDKASHVQKTLYN